ncbi:hypothetical protein BRADI_4g29856v3 [Brachypodium distachyon]|uniref:Reverse transcriptase zinc-binding domain-containing protein n=1 Tax=Brachypodium distachyon TaxID=15368 RepID=A0A2K2CR64_BRADI|nr:hypothetical protein BRADI_4g29856v3 [Brachypodium distachyon]
MKKRHIEKPESCVFCAENETVYHLFFECAVAKIMWQTVSLHFNKQLGADLESIARLWISHKKHGALNSICAAILWCIWKFRNSFTFYNAVWISSNQLWWLILRTLQKWKIIYKQEILGQKEALLSTHRQCMTDRFYAEYVDWTQYKVKGYTCMHHDQ